MTSVVVASEDEAELFWPKDNFYYPCIVVVIAAGKHIIECHDDDIVRPNTTNKPYRFASRCSVLSVSSDYLELETNHQQFFTVYFIILKKAVSYT